MPERMITVRGVVIEGHGVASGQSQDYPYSSLERQKPFFKAGGLDLDLFFQGTLNISISPLRFEMLKPSYTFRQVAWTTLHPPEDFSFSPCGVEFEGKRYDGYVYYPHPETKIRHFQDPTMIEVITHKIPRVGYGTQLKLSLNRSEIRIIKE